MVKIPRTVPTAAGCEKLAPFLMTAEKHAIWVCVAFEKIRRTADPSKSGMLKAMLGIPETSDFDTGMIAWPTIGTLLFNGHRLLMLEMLLRDIKRHSPFKVRIARIEDEVESIFAVYIPSVSCFAFSSRYLLTSLDPDVYYSQG
jgi:hypothetical protein